jgi:hypothetical protein
MSRLLRGRTGFVVGAAVAFLTVAGFAVAQEATETTEPAEESAVTEAPPAEIPPVEAPPAVTESAPETESVEEDLGRPPWADENWMPGDEPPWAGQPGPPPWVPGPPPWAPLGEDGDGPGLGPPWMRGEFSGTDWRPGSGPPPWAGPEDGPEDDSGD